MTTATLAGDTTKTTRADQRRAMGGAAERDRRAQAAYDAGVNGVPEAEHFAGRDDTDPLERDSYQAGVTERRTARRRQATTRAATGARSIAGASGGYLARAGRSVTRHAGDVPTGGGGGSWVGVLVGILGLIALYILLGNRNNVATKAINGVGNAFRWLAAPSPLPF